MNGRAAVRRGKGSMRRSSRWSRTPGSNSHLLGPSTIRATHRRDPGQPTDAPWGFLAAIDLHGCDRGQLEDPESIREFVPHVIHVIGMRAHGPLRLDRFGDGELEGWSAMQFIETSSITIHADEVAGRCFIDVFSCRPFDPGLAAEIAVAHFGGTAAVTVLQR